MCCCYTNQVIIYYASGYSSAARSVSPPGGGRGRLFTRLREGLTVGWHFCEHELEIDDWRNLVYALIPITVCQIFVIRQVETEHVN